MLMSKILIIEDEPAVCKLLVYNLEKAHYQTWVAQDGVQGLSAALQWKPDLVVLDIMLPQMDGLEVCRQLRQSSAVPILFLTARTEEIDRVLGLELGADDYLCKPFSMRELLARIKAILRRAAPLPSAPSPTFQMDPAQRTFTVHHQPLVLTKLEFDLIAVLMTHAGQVFSREQLLQVAWGYDYFGDTRAVDSAIKRLRAKLREVAPDEDPIEALRGIGYRWKAA